MEVKLLLLLLIAALNMAECNVGAGSDSGIYIIQLEASTMSVINHIAVLASTKDIFSNPPYIAIRPLLISTL